MPPAVGIATPDCSRWRISLLVAEGWGIRRKVCSAGVHAALHLVEGPRASPTSSNCLADEFGGHARSDIVQNSQMIGGGLDLVGERKVGGTGT